MKYKHIVFDIDGTLIDTEYAVLHSLQETIKARVSVRNEKYIDEALVKRWLERITVWEDHFTVELKSELKIDIDE